MYRALNYCNMHFAGSRALPNRYSEYMYEYCNTVIYESEVRSF